jgi:hypothetical protein
MMLSASFREIQPKRRILCDAAVADSDPAAGDLLPQNDCPFVVEADQMRVFLPVSMPMV